MTVEGNSAEKGRIPTNWDVLHSSSVEDEAVNEEAMSITDGPNSPPTINLLASSWADIVAALAVCTVALLGLNASGHSGSLTALPWAAGLGVVWWLVAAATLVTIRQGTPGMLLAGVHFRSPVAPKRVALVVAAAVVSAVLFGLPSLLGASRSPIALAGASTLEAIPAD